jgi:erythromycin esterase
LDEVLNWISRTALPIDSVQPGRGFVDLEPLRGTLAQARIVSLGEATHGSREFFLLKHRLIEYCVSQLGFTVFGIEANYTECLRVNEYVLHGRGNAADALGGTRFWTWDTEEMLTLIEWMRAWNDAHHPKVKFFGFDMQFSTEAALSLLRYLNLVAPDLASSGELMLWPLCADTTATRFRWLPSATQRNALASIQLIRHALLKERLAWVAASSDEEWQHASLNVRVLEQSIRYQLPEAGSSARDIAMAENVAAMLEHEGADAKAILWAHNGHVARESHYAAEDGSRTTNMGSRLHELFGAQHVVIGFAFNGGSFQAQKPGQGLVDHTVAPAPETSLDGTLAATKIPMFFIKLSNASPCHRVADWLSSKPASRWIGAVYSETDPGKYYYKVDPRSNFNVLGFVAETTASRPTLSGRRPTWLSHHVAPAAGNLCFKGQSDIPDGWVTSGNWRAHGHVVTLCEMRTPLGGRTVRISRASAPWRWGEGWIAQTFSAEPHRGTRLRFGASARADVEGPGAAAHLRRSPIQVARRYAMGAATQWHRYA